MFHLNRGLIKSRLTQAAVLALTFALVCSAHPAYARRSGSTIRAQRTSPSPASSSATRSGTRATSDYPPSAPQNDPVPLRFPRDSAPAPSQTTRRVYVDRQPAPQTVPQPAPQIIILPQGQSGGSGSYSGGYSGGYNPQVPATSGSDPDYSDLDLSRVHWSIDWGMIGRGLLILGTIAGGIFLTVKIRETRAAELIGERAGDWFEDQLAPEMENQKGVVVVLTVTVLDSMPGLEGLVKSLLAPAGRGELDLDTVEGVKWLLERLSESLTRRRENVTHAFLKAAICPTRSRQRQAFEQYCAFERARFEEDSEYISNGRLVKQAAVTPVLLGALGNGIGRYVCFSFVLGLRHDRSPLPAEIRTANELISALITLQALDPEHFEGIQISYSPSAEEILAGDTLSEEDFIEMYPESVALG